MIIFWNNHSSTAFGSAARHVRCENCAAEYGYILDRHATGHAVSLFFLDESGASERAKSRAQRGLQRALERGVEPRPCPKCDHLQRDMVREARRRYLGWLSFRTTFFVLLVSPAVFLFSLLVMNALSGREFIIPLPLFYRIWVGIIAAILLMPFLRLVLASLYRPDRLTPERLVDKGYYRGIALEDWEEAQERTEVELRRLGISYQPERHARPTPGREAKDPESPDASI